MKTLAMLRRTVVGRAALAALLMALTRLAQSQVNPSMPLYQLHGSGTSNPALLIWRVMDTMMARTKPKIAMSYRSIGSGAGGDEFAALTSSAFGCGDVPISPTNFNRTQQQNNSMMHVPFLVGSVSIFHNIPGIGEGLYLPPCTLARIFRGEISQWNHTEIVTNNTHLPDLAKITASIGIVHRNNGSSSTYALTHYLNRTCQGEWSAKGQGVGVSISWSSIPPGRRTMVTNSQTMVEQIAANPYSLGYVESGQGLLAGLEEVQILNANNLKLTSSEAAIAPEPFIASQFPLANLTNASWTDVNPVYAPSASENQWPLTLGTYFYVRTNLSYLNETGGLLKLFLSYMLSDDVAALMPEYSFTALPKKIRQDLTLLLTSTIVDVLPPVWRTENGTETIEGQRDFVFSPKRDSYIMNTMTTLVAGDKETKNTLKLGDAYQVHGSGSFVSALMIRHAMRLLQGRARVPISMTYRAVGSVEAQRELRDVQNMYSSYNHFKVGDMPLTTSIWSELNSPTAQPTIGAVLQLPFAISALGIYHTKSFGWTALTLNCSLLAQLYRGQIEGWKDPKIFSLNGAASSIADQRTAARVTVFAMAAPSGATYALTGFLAKSCPGDWTLSPGPITSVAWGAGVNTTFQGQPITTPEEMLAALAATPNAIGYLPVTLGATSGLAEAQLEITTTNNNNNSKSNRIGMVSKQANLALVVTQARSQNPAIFMNSSGDVAAVLGSYLYGQNDTWPMPMVQYLYMFRNLSGYGYSGPLLRAFVEFLIPGTLNTDGSELAASSGLTPMPVEVQEASRAAVAAVTLRTLTVTWFSEAAGLADVDTGAALYTFSANRESYDVYQLGELQSAVQRVQARLEGELPTVLRVACTADTFGYVRLLRGDVQDMASSPVRILDEMGTPTNIVAMLRASLLSATTSTTSAAAAGSSAPTHVVVHPGPLPHDVWENISVVAPVVQIPVSIRPVAVVYKGDPGLNLTLCVVAGIINRTITSWNDTQIRDNNPNMNLPNTSINLLFAGPYDADLSAILLYVRKGADAAKCPQFSGLQGPPSSVSPVAGGGDVLTQLVDGDPLSGLAFLAAASLVSERAAGAGLCAAALPGTMSGTFVTPLQAPGLISDSYCRSSGCPLLVGKAYTVVVEVVADSLTGKPYDPTGDWSGISLTYQKEGDLYPVARFDFLVLPADLSKFGNDGAALQGVVSYATSQTLMSRIQQALAPYFSALGPRALALLSVPGRDALVLPLGSPGWTVTNTSTEQAANPSTTIVLARAPSVFDSALAGSLASSLASSLGGVTTGASTATDLQAQNQNQQIDIAKLDRAYSIAVAALVLGLVLSVLALVLALYAVSLVRSGFGGGGGCLSPGAGPKYELQQLDVPISHVEMRVQS